jgi:hypothetical protein
MYMGSDPVEEIKRKMEARQLTPEEAMAVFDALSEVYKEYGLDVREDIVPGNPVTKKVIPPEKWKDRLLKRATAAASDWLEGIKSPSRDPIKAAIEADSKWKDRLTQAMKEDRRKKALEKVSHADIVAVVEKLGERTFVDGITAREAKIAKRIAELQPLVQAVSDAIQAMPDATDADREKRLIMARRLMIEVGKKRRGIA